MKNTKWTSRLALIGLVGLAPATWAQVTNAPAAASTNAPAAAPVPIPLTTALTATTISGYVDTSMVWNPGTGNANPAPYSFNTGKQDGFNLDSVDVKLARPADAGDWGAGYVLELQSGADVVTANAPIRQAYVELTVPLGNGIDFQIGQWDNIIGYELNDDYKNPNWSRSYGYTIEPTSHTGVEGTYKFSDEISFELGVVNSITSTGNGRNFDGTGGSAIESKKALVSLLSLTAPTNWGSIGGSALYFGLDYGPGNALNVAKTHNVDKTHLYVGATINTPIDNLTFGLSWDSVNNSDAGPSGVEGYASALDLYASYKLTDKATLNARAEYAHGSAYNSLFGQAAVPLEQETKVFALTGTFQYSLWANVISRAEVRWDASADGSPHFGGIGSPGTGVPATKNNDVELALNVIYKF